MKEEAGAGSEAQGHSRVHLSGALAAAAGKQTSGGGQFVGLNGAALGLKGPSVGPEPANRVEPPAGAPGDGEAPEKPATDWVHRAAAKIPCLGIIFSVLASLFLGSAGMLVKVTRSVHGVQISVFRATIQVIVYSIIMWMRRIKPRPAEGELWAVGGRALLGAFSITCSYFALKLAPLGDVTAIRFSLPIWTLIVGYFALGESCSLLKTSAVVVSLTGVALVAKPDDCLRVIYLLADALNISHPESSTPPGEPAPQIIDSELADFVATFGNGTSQLPPAHTMVDTQVKGCLLALSSSICLAMSIVALRMCRRSPVEVIIFWLSFLSVVSGALVLLMLEQWHMPDNLQDVFLIILNGFCGVVGQWFMSNALKVEQSGVISLARTLDISVAFSYSAFLLHETIHTTSIIGAVLVSYGTIAVALPKLIEARRKSRKEKSIKEPEVASAKA